MSNPKRAETRGWEIVSVKSPRSFIVFDGTPYDNKLKEIISSGEQTAWAITSVKRLSDDKIFSVGDDVVFTGECLARKIKSFRIIPNSKEMIVSDGIWNILLNGVQHSASKETTESKYWEIVSFKNKNGTILKVVGPDCVQGGGTISYHLKREGDSIHSVKRLSDGEIFTIGDEYEIHNKIYKLHHFFINEGGGMFLNDDEKTDLGLNITVARKILRPSKSEEGKTVKLTLTDANRVPEKKDWQVECFSDGHRNWWRKKDGLYTNQPFEKGIAEEHFLNRKEYSIWQVTRLSDSTVFSVGDEVMVDKEDEPKNWIGKIDSFWLTHKAEGFKQELHIVYNGHHYDIKYFKKVVTTQPEIKENKERQPIGVIPEWRWKELRFEELANAITRYRESGYHIPGQWIKEQIEIMNWLSLRQYSKESVCGVNLLWEIHSHPTHLGHVMKASDCRFIGTREECEEFIEKYKPKRIEAWIRCTPGTTNLNDGKGDRHCHNLYTTCDVIPQDKAKLIESAIERILNNNDDDVDALRKELKATDALVKMYRRVLDVIPECDLHGPCVPHAIDWINEKKDKLYSQQQLDEAITNAFNEARVDLPDYSKYSKYATANDYLKSLK